MLRKRVLRSGYSTGACAAAAAKAAAMLLLDAGARKRRSARTIEIPFPDGSRVKFKAYGSGLDSQGHSAWASVIKDAGDDPDVTNGAEIVAHVKVSPDLVIRGGRGVGVVTKPGLPVAVGDAAINPVPRAMIKEAVMEAIKESENSSLSFEVIISVPRGEELAKKT
ncbi:MAG TPA: cobalt-precorrin-5B (C(1))-methyltransferase, partial [Dissulfurispiraceae bacterium]